MVKELHIATIRTDIKNRLKIYRSWLDYATGDGVLGLDSYACFYHYMKHTIGAGLPSYIEIEMVGKSANVKPGDVSQSKIDLAKKCGMFRDLKPGFSKYQAVAWGAFCCEKLFASYGVSADRLIDQLDLSLIIGSSHKTFVRDPEKVSMISQLVMESKTLSEICIHAGMGKAEVFAYIWGIG